MLLRLNTFSEYLIQVCDGGLKVSLLDVPSDDPLLIHDILQSFSILLYALILGVDLPGLVNVLLCPLKVPETHQALAESLVSSRKVGVHLQGRLAVIYGF